MNVLKILLLVMISCSKGIDNLNFISKGIDDDLIDASITYGDYVNQVGYLINKGANVNNALTNGLTPLMFASASGNTGVVKLLLDKGANINHIDKSGFTPLMKASEVGRTEVVRILLDKGANINHVSFNGYTALMIASQRGFTGVVKLLLDRGANIDAKTNNGYTALILASKNGHIKVVKLLDDHIEKSKLITTPKEVKTSIIGKKEPTPLTKASECGDVEKVKTLLKEGVDVNAKDNNGNTALMIASKKGHKEIAELLLEKGADIVDNKDNIIEKTLFNNIKNSNIERSLFMLYKYNKINFGINDEQGNTLLHYSSLLNNVTLFDIFLDKIDKNILNNRGETPLYYALCKKDFDKDFIYYAINKECILKPNSNINNIPLSTLLAQYDLLSDRLIYDPISSKLLGTVDYKEKDKLREIIKALELKDKDFDENKDMISFIKHLLTDTKISIELINIINSDLNNNTELGIKDIINKELMQLRYNILKDICEDYIDKDKIEVNVKLVKGMQMPDPLFLLTNEMSEELKLKKEPIGNIKYSLTYNKNEIVELVLKQYEDRIVKYVKDKIEENRVLWNRVADYIEREIFSNRSVLTIEDFLHDKNHIIKDKTVKALLSYLNLVTFNN